MKKIFDVEYLEVQDVSNILGLSKITIYQYIREDKLKPHCKLGRNYLFVKESVERFFHSYVK